MKESVQEFIQNQLKNRLPFVKFSEERYYSIYYTVETANLQAGRINIPLTPVSFSNNKEFSKKHHISGEVKRLKGILPHIAFEDLSDYILYVEDIETLDQFFYKKSSSPKAVITNSKIEKPLQLDFPVFYTDKKIIYKTVDINLKVKTNKKEAKNFFLERGVSARTVYIHFPFDERFCNKDKMHFFASFESMVRLTSKLLSQQDLLKGYTVKFILSNTYLSDYEGLRYHISGEKKRVETIINVEGAGLGNEKVIYKVRNNILSLPYYNRIKGFLKNREGEYFNEKQKFQKLKDYSTIDKITQKSKSETQKGERRQVQTIWLTSQPNSLKYSLRKEFLTIDYVLEYVDTMFNLLDSLFTARKNNTPKVKVL
ncbi:MAG: hypothetical protein GXO45_01950 [Aquificae bacterium]|nr:hypothetical protein [Aquificota bacterium]